MQAVKAVVFHPYCYARAPFVNGDVGDGRRAALMRIVDHGLHGPDGLPFSGDFHAYGGRGSALVSELETGC